VADAEPQPDIERLAGVRPDPRPSSDHAGHDRWLVVRWTTDPADLSPGETAQARALLAGCTDCAALAADLGIITRATASSIVPARPRDFRLTPAQAAGARGSIIDRARRWLGSPGSAVVRPLAGAGVAMGLVLVLLAPSLQPAGGSGADPQPVTAPGSTSVLKATSAPPEGPDAAGVEMFATGTADPAAAEADTTQLRMADSPPPSANGDTATRESATDAPDPLVAEAPVESAGDEASGAVIDDTTFALTLLGIVLAGVGLLVLVLTWLARRWQDPLLR
jgi:hypothetical protein